jgi:ATP-dependent helicase/nuclease subunit B
MSTPSVFNIPANYPFVDALASSLLTETASNPMDLSRYQILLPTRRACRALQEAFLRHSDGSTVILPKLTPLGDLESDEIEFDAIASGEALADLELDPPTSSLTRQFLLCQLIMKLPVEAGGAREIDSALDLAGALAQLLDQVETEGLSWDRLDNLISDEEQNYQEHWQKILAFLSVVISYWPEIEKTLGTIGPAARRRALLERQKKIWQNSDTSFPLIIAGSTGSIPAVAELIKSVAHLPHGRIILPGLDQHHSQDRWDLIMTDPGHPQFGLAKLLDFLELKPEKVKPWPLNPDLKRASDHRRLFLSTAMLPAAMTTDWKSDQSDSNRANITESLEAVELIECEQAEEEAGIIALILREALETPNQTAALVTPDRNLARRTAAALQRWDIEVDDSAGQPLSNTAVGTFIRLIAWAVVEKFSPARLLALTKHPLMLKGEEQSQAIKLIRAIEIVSLRGPRPSPGLASLIKDLKNEKRQPELIEFLSDLEQRTSSFSNALHQGSDLTTLLKFHIELAESLAGATDEQGQALWVGDDGSSLNSFMAELLQTAEETSSGFGTVPASSYPSLLEKLMQKQTVRPKFGMHPRLAIWGAIEGRLQQAEVIVLGALNESLWPKETDPGPWMSRAMRRDFGLPPVERKIGLGAHDFCQAFNARKVFLTRSLKIDGAPSIPSRWLMRIAALLDASGVGSETIKGRKPWQQWHQSLNNQENEAFTPKRPQPTPAVELRPKKISVTDVEVWQKNPYAIYAKRVLRLGELDELDADPGAAEKGNLVHKALEKFVTQYPIDLPEEPEKILHAIGREVFADLIDRPGVWAFWWPRFLRIADWFIAEERGHRTVIKRSNAEKRGQLSIAGPLGDVTLTGVADRINELNDGTLSIIDYKTGTPPGKSEVRRGETPQLSLEAAMLKRGGFEGFTAAETSQLAYWQLKGGNPAGEIKLIAKEADEVLDLAEDAIKNLESLIAEFSKLETSYTAKAAEEGGPRYDPYTHLARTKEWYGIDEGEPS